MRIARWAAPAGIRYQSPMARAIPAIPAPRTWRRPWRRWATPPAWTWRRYVPPASRRSASWVVASARRSSEQTQKNRRGPGGIPSPGFLLRPDAHLAPPIAARVDRAKAGGQRRAHDPAERDARPRPPVAAEPAG